MDAQRPICICGAMNRLASSGVQLFTDPLTGEWQFRLANGNVSPARYCFACGGVLPSRRTTPSETELENAIGYLRTATSLKDIEELLGVPQEVHSGEDVSFPPDVMQWCRMIVYSKKWESFDLVVMEDVKGQVYLGARPKIKRESNTDLGLQ